MTKRPMFVVAAQVASHVHNATQVTKQLSLTAKNARAVAVRAGQQAAGFRAITDFIEELAGNTIRLARDINETAVSLSHLASEQERSQRAAEMLDEVRSKAANATHLNSIGPVEKAIQQTNYELREQFRQQFFSLDALLTDIRRQIQSAGVIASTSKVEAINSGSYRAQLETVAENIEQAAQRMQHELSIASRLLEK
ncbi:MAG: chemotaxis protein [Cellvibrionaceae bacterium]